MEWQILQVDASQNASHVPAQHLNYAKRQRQHCQYRRSRYAIGEDELQRQFTRALEPGGQNVNTVSTAVQLRWPCTCASMLLARRRYP
jgi:protein subunit release factor B